MENWSRGEVQEKPSCSQSQRVNKTYEYFQIGRTQGCRPAIRGGEQPGNYPREVFKIMFSCEVQQGATIVVHRKISAVCGSGRRREVKFILQLVAIYPQARRSRSAIQMPIPLPLCSLLIVSGMSAPQSLWLGGGQISEFHSLGVQNLGTRIY